MTCLPLTHTPTQLLATFDVVIVLNAAAPGPELRKCLRSGARLILWTQHAADQPAMQSLREPTVAAAFDAIVFVSCWQEQQYRAEFGERIGVAQVLRNAAAPAFINHSSSAADVWSGKSQPPILAYTSTPFRGLDVLIELFPRIRQAAPGVRLRVYSSMRVYQVGADADDVQFGHLYRRCRETEGIDYIGSIPQPQLAGELAAATVLAYPNTFAETSCIAVLEAMACGCQVVTSALGALPETTGGFGRLIAFGADRAEYGRQFVAAVVAALEAARHGDAVVTAQLNRQMEFMRQEGNWRRRATQWSSWLRAVAFAG